MRLFLQKGIITVAVLLTSMMGLYAQQGIIKGVLVDKSNQKPVEFANAALLKASDSTVVTGANTDLDGSFQIRGLNTGNYILRLSFVGYESLFKTVNLSANNLNVDLGKLAIVSEGQNLEEVVVQASKPLFESDINKRTFNVENSIVSEGGSATDILETIPSITVDQDGGIALRGSGSILVLIDGKPSSLTGTDRGAILDQLPANIIAKVEVITNPSAKYDAEGVGGIINIILKKDQVQGFNGNVNASVGTRNKYNGGVNLNYRKNKFNFFGGYSYRYNERFNIGENSRENTNFEQATFLDQNTRGDRKDIDHVFRIGADYNITDNTSFGLSYVYNTEDENDTERIEFRNLNFQREIDSLYVRNNLQRESGSNYEVAANFMHKFDTSGTELSVIASYSENGRDEFEFFDQRALNPDFTEAPFDPFLQRNTNTRANSFSIVQADFINPFSETGKFEAGYRSTFRKVDRDQLFENFENEAQEYQLNNDLSNRFIFDEQVHALYAIYTNEINKFGYQFGLRAEQTLTESVTFSDQGQTVQPFENNYANLFPSVFFSYNLGVEQDIQLNYSRRIRRPSIWNLNPFVDNSDPLNIQFGNPELDPELTDSYELSYLKGWEKVFVTSSIFYRNTQDIIQRVISVDENNVSTVTFDNLDSRTAFGVEFINRITPSNNFDATLTYNLFRQQVNGNSLGTNFNNANISWSLNLQSNIKIPEILDIQVQGFYRGPIALAQGILKDFYSINLGLRRDILKDKGTISMNVSDVFNTRRFEVETSGIGFSQQSLRRRESRIATLTFTYRFGGFKEKEGRADAGGNGGDQDYGF